MNEVLSAEPNTELMPKECYFSFMSVMEEVI